jgi:molybdenum cofactor biosynthesis enzyme MoaA
VTDRCNFRCRYGMPSEDLPRLEHDLALTFGEIEPRLGPLVSMDVRDVRLAGGRRWCAGAFRCRRDAGGDLRA